MDILSEVLNHKIIIALGWDIFHILWQGSIIAILLGITLKILKGKSSHIRYRASFISLILLIGLFIFNFTNNYKTNEKVSSQRENLIKSQDETPLNVDFEVSPIHYPLIVTLKELKNRIKQIDVYFPLIVNLWILGVILFALRFILSYLYTSRLRVVKTNKVPEYWQEQFLAIENKLKIKKTVKYLESRLIKIPLVLGHLKPVILIPAEMLSGIPQDQIEAIIAHEIAHIRRNDYIINVLQTIIETVFFFHPAVWYISSQIRKERENSCDDIALSVCDDSIIYAKALVSVQELTLNRHYSAVAFSGKRKHLLNRIKRMIMKPKAKSNFTDKIIASIVIFAALTALSFTYASNMVNYNSEKILFQEVNSNNQVLANEIKTPDIPPKPVKPAQPEKISKPHMVKDTVKIRKHHHEEINIDENTVIKTYSNADGKKKEMKFTLKNGKATELYIDGKKIPESEYGKYQAEIDKTIHSLKEAKEDIRKAMKEVEELDVEKIQREVELAMKDVHIDMDEIQKNIKISMEEAHDIDIEDMVREVEMQLRHLEDIDFDFDQNFDIEIDDLDINLDDVREKIEKAQKSIKENIDMEAIKKEIQQAQEELSNVNMEEIRKKIEKNVQEFETYDKQKTLEEMEYKLQELENLELEEK